MSNIRVLKKHFQFMLKSETLILNTADSLYYLNPKKLPTSCYQF